MGNITYLVFPLPLNIRLSNSNKAKCAVCGEEKYKGYMKKLNGKYICSLCYERIKGEVLDKLILKEIEKGWNPSKRKRGK